MQEIFFCLFQVKLDYEDGKIKSYMKGKDGMEIINVKEVTGDIIKEASHLYVLSSRKL